MSRRRSLLVALSCVMALLLAACGAPTPEPLTVPTWTGVAAAPSEPVTPSGSLVVALAEEPAVWYPPLTVEPAAGDLAALWGLPLYRIDPFGQLRPGLARTATPGPVGDDGWTVEVSLHEGEWSDGVPVTSGDVVATVDALLSSPAAPQLVPLTGAVAVDERTVELRFAQPTGRWPYLFAGGSILPAHVLAERGLDAYRSSPEVTGGPFRVTAYDPGRLVRFEAHESSPEGAPRLRELEIAFVPSYDTALGLLQDGRIDVSIGHLALNPVERAGEVDAVRAGAPLGGTTVSLVWRAGGALGGAAPGAVDRRQRTRDAIDVSQQVEGLLGDFGAVSRSVIPGRAGPWGGGATAGGLEGVEPSLAIPHGQEAVSFTARSIQRDLRTFGGGAELIRLEPDRLAGSTQGDGALVVRRDVPWPSLSALLATPAPEALSAAARAADAAVHIGAPEVVEASSLLHDAGHVLPLYQVGVAHVWSEAVEGVRPSAWPGAGLWNAAQWQLASR